MDNVTLKEQVSGDFLKWEIMESKGGTDKYTLQVGTHTLTRTHTHNIHTIHTHTKS